MLRIVIETCNAEMAVACGGSVEKTIKTFDVSLPELEEFCKKTLYRHWNAIGIELLSDSLEDVGNRVVIDPREDALLGNWVAKR